MTSSTPCHRSSAGAGPLLAPGQEAVAMGAGGGEALKVLLEDLQQVLLRLFARRRRAPARRRGPLQRQLVLGLELLWKIEEQVLLPALRDAAPPLPPHAVSEATEHVDVLRDLAMLATQARGGNRELALSALERMATLHFAGSLRLLAQAPPAAADWQALEREVRGLLARWRGEVRAHGEIEDEDRDPVGLPPR